MRVAFLATRREKPSYRFRVEQFLPFFRARGMTCDLFFIPRPTARRWALFRSLRDHDIVFLQKKLLGPADRKLLRSSARRLVYDVDDAIVFAQRGLRTERSGKRRRRFLATVGMSDLVLAGNDYLCGMAAESARWVVCHRTVVDTDRYAPAPRGESSPPVIGWSGSRSTNRYLNTVLPAVARVAERRPVVLRVLSDNRDGIDFSLCGKADVEFRSWGSSTEARDIRSFDIGLMPLPRGEWSRGKCALKALLYMASGVPAVCSAVGEVKKIITDGEDGVLVESDEGWSSGILALLADPALRRGIAERARDTVVGRYSVSVLAPRAIELFAALAEGGRAR